MRNSLVTLFGALVVGLVVFSCQQPLNESKPAAEAVASRDAGPSAPVGQPQEALPVEEAQVEPPPVVPSLNVHDESRLDFVSTALDTTIEASMTGAIKGYEDVVFHTTVSGPANPDVEPFHQFTTVTFDDLSDGDGGVIKGSVKIEWLMAGKGKLNGELEYNDVKYSMRDVAYARHYGFVAGYVTVDGTLYAVPPLANP